MTQQTEALNGFGLLSFYTVKIMLNKNKIYVKYY